MYASSTFTKRLDNPKRKRANPGKTHQSKVGNIKVY